MSTDPDDFVATHQSPVWRELSNFVFHAHIGTRGNRNEWEQLWGKFSSPNEVMICCIPFFLYGIYLGDKVIIDDSQNLHSIKEKSNQRTLRVWFEDRDAKYKSDFLYRLSRPEVSTEFYSKNLLAISVPKIKFDELELFLISAENSGEIQYEVG